ncbi:MAG: protein-tyrosine phosphatase [Desulforhopalus sp.]|jgi:protein-tyrosine phosphatase
MTEIKNFIDIHTHILHGLDDGPKNLQESLALARCYEISGVKRVIATPHFLPGTAWAPTKEKVLYSVQNLQEHLDKEGIVLKIEAGMEIAYHGKMADRILAGDLLSLGNSGYYLIEPSFHGEQDNLIATVGLLLSQGIKIILAHPERIGRFQDHTELLERLVVQGTLLQINAGSLLGCFGKKSKVMAESLANKQLFHFIASDAHNHDKRAPITEQEWRALASCSVVANVCTTCLQNIDRIFSK